jgi:cell division protein FtsW
MKFTLFHKGNKPDYWLIGTIVPLSLFGLLMVYNSSVAMAIRDFGNQYYYLQEQAKWLGLGLIILCIFSCIDYRFWKRIAFPTMIGTIVLLCIVLLPGIGIQALGAKRWINLGFFVLQPAEFAKLSMIIYLSAWFSGKSNQRLISFLVLLGVFVGLIMLEPDLGTAMILILTSIGVYFFSGAPLQQFALVLPVIGVGVTSLALFSPYRFKRLLTFFNPEQDPLGASYHIRQAIIAIGSGGIFGVGLGQSRQKYEYLPEANTDSIFAIIGEELGFIGCVALIAVYIFILWRGFRIARRMDDTFGRNLALGITTWIGIQTIINISAMVALIPLTGVPLPFISYGGSSLIIMFAACGILINISRFVRQ